MVTSAKQLGMCDAFLAKADGMERRPRAGQASGVCEHPADAANTHLPHAQPYREADASRSPENALPPSERDFLVFEAVAVHGSSTRQAAAEFDISQTRVMQVRQHVAEWIAKAVPDGLDLTPQERVRLAAHIAQGRVDFLYSQALEAWRASQKPHTSVCRGRLTGETRTTRDSHGDPRYLLAAARLSERQLSLAGTARKVLEVAESGSKFNVQGSKSGVQGSGFRVQDESVGEASRLSESPPLEDHREADASRSPAIAHPLRDCSAGAAELQTAIVRLPDAELATADGDETCREIENRRRAFLAALENDTAPVHPPFTDAGGLLLDSSESALVSVPAHVSEPAQDSVIELKVNGNQPGATLTATGVTENASLASHKRHERRVRQRELDRLRRRAR
jgi:hypothetical protein